MTPKVPDEVMPTLYLTRAEELQIEREADELARDALDAFDSFVANGRVFPKALWKKVRQKDGYRVYRSKHSYARTLSHTSNADARVSQSGSSSSSKSSSSWSASGSSTTATEAMLTSASSRMSASSPMLSAMHQYPVIVLTGIVPGTVEDAAFGNIADNDAIWRLRSAYIHDEHRDGKILATLTHATPENPFAFAGIKWAWPKQSVFVTQRDMVYIEKTDVLRSATDHAITAAYTLMHSIELPGIPELSNYALERMRLSLCYASRPHDAQSIEVYCRAFSVPVGDVPARLVIPFYADALLASVDVVECSYMKKLMWLTRQRQRQRLCASTSRYQQGEDAPAATCAATATHCQACERALKRFGGLPRSTTTCWCCHKVVCTKCSSARKVVLDLAADGAVTQKALPFCVQCVLEARALPALDIARATAIRWYDN